MRFVILKKEFTPEAFGAEGPSGARPPKTPAAKPPLASQPNLKGAPLFGGPKGMIGEHIRGLASSSHGVHLQVRSDNGTPSYTAPVKGITHIGQLDSNPTQGFFKVHTDSGVHHTFGDYERVKKFAATHNLPLQHMGQLSHISQRIPGGPAAPNVHPYTVDQAGNLNGVSESAHPIGRIHQVNNVTPYGNGAAQARVSTSDGRTFYLHGPHANIHALHQVAAVQPAVHMPPPGSPPAPAAATPATPATPGGTQLGTTPKGVRPAGAQGPTLASRIAQIGKQKQPSPAQRVSVAGQRSGATVHSPISNAGGARAQTSAPSGGGSTKANAAAQMAQPVSGARRVFMAVANRARQAMPSAFQNRLADNRMAQANAAWQKMPQMAANTMGRYGQMGGVTGGKGQESIGIRGDRTGRGLEGMDVGPVTHGSGGRREKYPSSLTTPREKISPSEARGLGRHGDLGGPRDAENQHRVSVSGRNDFIGPDINTEAHQAKVTPVTVAGQRAHAVTIGGRHIASYADRGLAEAHAKRVNTGQKQRVVFVASGHGEAVPAADEGKPETATATAAPSEQKRSAGRPKGSRNQATIEREQLAAKQQQAASASSQPPAATATPAEQTMRRGAGGKINAGSSAAAPPPINISTDETAPAKRGRGRPPGSKNKGTAAVASQPSAAAATPSATEAAPAKRGRGRPPGIKNKGNASAQEETPGDLFGGIESTETPAERNAGAGGGKRSGKGGRPARAPVWKPSTTRWGSGKTATYVVDHTEGQKPQIFDSKKRATSFALKNGILHPGTGKVRWTAGKGEAPEGGKAPKKTADQKNEELAQAAKDALREFTSPTPETARHRDEDQKRGPTSGKTATIPSPPVRQSATGYKRVTAPVQSPPPGTRSTGKPSESHPANNLTPDQIKELNSLDSDQLNRYRKLTNSGKSHDQAIDKLTEPESGAEQRLNDHTLDEAMEKLDPGSVQKMGEYNRLRSKNHTHEEAAEKVWPGSAQKMKDLARKAAEVNRYKAPERSSELTRPTPERRGAPAAGKEEARPPAAARTLEQSKQAKENEEATRMAVLAHLYGQGGKSTPKLDRQKEEYHRLKLNNHTHDEAMEKVWPGSVQRMKDIGSLSDEQTKKYNAVLGVGANHEEAMELARSAGESKPESKPESKKSDPRPGVDKLKRFFDTNDKYPGDEDGDEDDEDEDEDEDGDHEEKPTAPSAKKKTPLAIAPTGSGEKAPPKMDANYDPDKDDPEGDKETRDLARLTSKQQKAYRKLRRAGMSPGDAMMSAQGQRRRKSKEEAGTITSISGHKFKYESGGAMQPSAEKVNLGEKVDPDEYRTYKYKGAPVRHEQTVSGIHIYHYGAGTGLSSYLVGSTRNKKTGELEGGEMHESKAQALAAATNMARTRKSIVFLVGRGARRLFKRR